MLKTRLLFCVLILHSCQQICAQVNQLTGSANYDIPIYTFTDNVSNLSIPISLGYNSGYGLKVDEVATDIGQGWGLMAGGVIVRMQVGQPDDQKALGGEKSSETSTGPNKLLKYPAGFLYTNEDPAAGAPLNYNKYPVFPGKNTLYRQHNFMNADRELDYFMLNVNGISATFVLKKGSTEGYFLGSTLMKVSFETVTQSAQAFSAGGVNSSARTVIKSFTVTDGNGIEYLFETKAYTKIRRQTSSDPQFLNQVDPPKKYRKRLVYHESYFDDITFQNPYLVNEWYLTKITDKLVGPSRSINLSYNYRALDQYTGFDYQKIDSKKNYGKAIARRSFVLQPVISSISCPNQYTINFVYGASRLDVPGSSVLQSIDVKYGTRFVQRHKLKQTYVIYTRYGTPVTAEQKLASRLYLLSVTKQTADLKDQENPILFDYYLGGGNKAEFVPPPFFVSKDNWGYYDGFKSLLGSAADDLNNIKPNLKSYCVKGTRGLIGPQFPTYENIKRLTFELADPLGVKPGYAKFGLLKTVNYPTGGRLEYYYDQNIGRFSPNETDRQVGGVHVTKTVVYDSKESRANCNTPEQSETTNYSYVDINNVSTLWGLERPVNSKASNSNYRPFDKKLDWKPWKLVPVKCKYGYQYPGIQYSDQAIGLNGFMAFMSKPGVQAGLEVLGVISNIFTVAKLISVGVSTTGVGAIIGLAIDIVLGLAEAIYTCFAQDDIKDNNITTWYNRNLKASNPLPMMYSRVEVFQNDGSNGKTATEYTNPTDFPIWESNLALFDMRQRYGIWLYGSPKNTTVYASNGLKVKEVKNYYTATECSLASAANTIESFKSKETPDAGDMARLSAKNATREDYYASVAVCNFSRIPLGITSCYIETLKGEPARSTDWEIFNTGTPVYQPSSSSVLAVNTYDVYTGKLRLDKTEEITYQQVNAGRSITKTTNYTYDPVYQNMVDLLLPKKVEEISPSGLRTQKETIYSYYNPPYTIPQYATDALNKLRNNNILTIPVHTLTKVFNPLKPEVFGTADFWPVSEEWPLFIETANGSVETKLTYQRRTANPDNNFTANPAVIVAENYYDPVTGLLISSKDEGGRTVENLFDYDNMLTVATAINIKDPFTETLAYNSFETTTGFGFTFSGTRTAGTSVTGSRYYALTATEPITAAITNPFSRPYTLSFWASLPVTVANATLDKTGPLRKGFTYYEYKVNAGSTSITISTASGTPKIDELRLYPSQARLTTTTYDPLLGKTSECDQSNHFTAYEYDTRGRLKLVKDEAGHIVKMYEYAERQNAGCPVTYLSNAVYHTIQRNNCAADYLGAYIEYNIPAGQFTSAISQEHADRLAQQQLDAMAQQYANANGSCDIIYKNVQVSAIFYSDNCGVSSAPVAYTYVVPAGKYASMVSQQDANDLATEDIDENGQDMADATGGCSPTTQGIWQGDDNSPMRCKTVNGLTTNVTQVQLKDVNPSSATYNQLQWFDMAENLLNCTVQTANTPIHVTNTTSSTYNIRLTNANNQTLYYDYFMYGNTVMSPIGSVPPGNYIVKIVGTNSYMARVGDQNTGYTQTVYNSPFTLFFYNINIQANPVYINISNP